MLPNDGVNHVAQFDGAIQLSSADLTIMFVVRIECLIYSHKEM